jgi:hypothetical protein
MVFGFWTLERIAKMSMNYCMNTVVGFRGMFSLGDEERAMFEYKISIPTLEVILVI